MPSSKELKKEKFRIPILKQKKKVPQTKVPQTKVPQTKVPQTKVPRTKVPRTTYKPTESESYFLSLSDFLAYFPAVSVTREGFIQRFTVKYRIPQTLADIFAFKSPLLKGNPLDPRYLQREEIIDLFYRLLITDRVAYLTDIYNAYFAFCSPHTLKWTGINLSDGQDGISLQKNDGAKRLIRNLFYKELLDLTVVSNTVKSHVSFWQSLLNMFNRLELEDRFFAPSSLGLCLKNAKNLFYLFQAYQPKASIFNPYTIKWILSDVIDKASDFTGKNKTFFTPVLSWSAYLMAFMHADNYQTYVGVDVMPTVCQKNRQLAEWYANEKSVSIHCVPSESLPETFLTEYRDFFDTIMVCPPYYNMEIYPEGQQSTSAYPDYQSWLRNYWLPTVSHCYTVAKPGGIFALIINDYCDLSGVNYALTHDLDAIVQQFFKPISMYRLKNRTSPLRMNLKDRTEKLILYKK